LRTAWRDEELPTWVAVELGLPPNSTFEALGVEVWSSAASFTDRLRNLLVWLVHSRDELISDLVVIDEPWPVALDVASIPWRSRTSNCLVKGEVVPRLKDLPSIRYRDLFGIQAMGALSILDFACTLEAAVDLYAGRFGDAQMKTAPGGQDETAGEPLLRALNQPWIDKISEADPRFAPLLPPGRGTLFERLEGLTSMPTDTPAQLQERALADAIPAIERRVEQINNETLGQSLNGYLQALTGFDGKKLEAFSSRFGLTGRPPVTLQAAASMIGVTRERIRQIETKITKLLPPHPVLMPALDAAISLLENNAPIDAETFGRLLVTSGLNREPFHPRALLSAAEMTGRIVNVKVTRAQGRDRFLASGAKDYSGKVISVASRQAEASGVSNVFEVSAELEAAGIAETPESVRSILQTYSDLSFLDTDWFWRPKTGTEWNRLRNLTRKMLSVATPMDLSDIREGVRRVFKYRGKRGNSGWPLLVAPRAILALFYEAHPEFVLRGGLLESTVPLDYKRELSPSEQVMVEVLRSSPTGLLERASFEKSSIERGVGRETFSVFTSYSSVIEHVSTDVWTLRGLKIDPLAVEALRQANAERPREKRILAHGWSPNGHLWMSVRLRGGNGVIGIPGTIRHLLSNRDFEAQGPLKAPIGTVRIDEDGTSWGYLPFLKRAGADDGDILLVDFDLTGGVATLSMSDDEELERLDPR
jgi:hypothetical protein